MAGKSPPHGGKSKADEGLGIFVDPQDEEALPIWVDSNLRFRRTLLRKLEVCVAYACVVRPAERDHDTPRRAKAGG